MDLDYFETFTITLIFSSIFVGGIVKGSVGIGMSMFSVPIIAFILPPTKAMMLLCFPVIVTNLIQMKIKQGINNYRFLPMFLILLVGILIGGNLILKLNFQTISIVIALTIIFFTLINFFGLNLKNIKQKNEKILSVIIGFFFRNTWWIIYVLCTTNNYLFSFIKFRKRKFYKNNSYNVFFSFNTIVFIAYLPRFR